MNRLHWLYELDRLLLRFADLGISADLATMSMIELWGIYCYLQRLAEA
jgi:hypothetical protein